MACATVVFWGFTFAFLETFDALAASLGVPGVLALFAAFCALDALFIFFTVIETRRKTLTEIQALFGGGRPCGEKEGLLGSPERAFAATV